MSSLPSQRRSLDVPVSQESAYEKLQGRTANLAAGSASGGLTQNANQSTAKASGARKSSKPEPTVIDSVFKAANSPIGRQIERGIVRGIMGSLFGTSRK